MRSLKSRTQAIQKSRKRSIQKPVKDLGSARSPQGTLALSTHRYSPVIGSFREAESTQGTTVLKRVPHLGLSETLCHAFQAGKQVACPGVQFR